jgi:hypothetical protein
VVRAYGSGTSIYELSRQFQVHRHSISIILERQGVPRRYRMVEGERLQWAIREYQAGRPIIAIANDLGVAGDTVRESLERAGVKLRPRRGWKY